MTNVVLPLTCGFEDCDKDSVALVGGKCASLGELIRAGVRVPPGFAVTTEAFQQFMGGAGIADTIYGVLDGLAENDIQGQETVSTMIRDLVENATFSIELEDEIAEAYRVLSVQCCVPAVPVAVRSSATAEDLPDASFAGQQDTFFWIRGVDDVLFYTRKCFSSLFTARAIAYRIRMNFDHREVALSVGIQKMANSHAAGVMFTLNPSNGDRSMILINSSFGFGEAVVSGEVTPDVFMVNKVSLDTVKQTITNKEVAYVVDHKSHTSTLVKLPAERRNVQSIVDEEVAELARMGKLIEKHYGKPMDIEWAIDNDRVVGGNLFILQARPETVWSNKKKASVCGGNKTAMDHILSSMMAGVRLE
ncbi:MAG TPA: phenylphosphate synthase subunit beta [Gammaproteobacteria bacterium]|nr:phenylphosphate synthase subunit beta [Gammaproteobacteria bacterium]